MMQWVSPFINRLCGLWAAVPCADMPSEGIQASHEPASHQAEADESDPRVELIEFCYWHMNDVIVLAVASPSAIGPANPSGTYLAILGEFG